MRILALDLGTRGGWAGYDQGLGVESVTINILVPIKGTGLESAE